MRADDIGGAGISASRDGDHAGVGLKVVQPRTEGGCRSDGQPPSVTPRSTAGVTKCCTNPTTAAPNGVCSVLTTWRAYERLRGHSAQGTPNAHRD